MPDLSKALAEDGPLAGNPNLTAAPDQAAVVWSSAKGESHRYLLQDTPALTPTGVPRYKFDRTLPPDESEEP